MSNMKKDIDCLPCRLVSGFGIIGIGTYLYTQANKRKGFHKNIMVVISAGKCCWVRSSTSFKYAVS
ncbi:uncharacterized protein LOC119677944 isoform X2 [Teleopsis dalmanni]|uniref:uncharacterized protein LOC119677944 isoform X2 n=1 Tax=Teleopsis dalmanni TaxID=139649 RepID=UPI0018CDECF0|nr:uncharacterized protein LOC119677944 isoform X2 [Teleopsis dalmanni]